MVNAAEPHRHSQPASASTLGVESQRWAVLHTALECVGGQRGKAVTSNVLKSCRVSVVLFLAAVRRQWGVRKILASTLQQEFLTPLAAARGNDDGTNARAAALAVLAGFDLIRTVLGIDALDERNGHELLVNLFALCLEH